MTQENKSPSPELLSLIKAAAESLIGFGELWGSIKKKGIDEGFSEKELQELLRPHLRQKFDSKQVWYLFHREEHIQRQKQNNVPVDRTKFRTNDAKKPLEQSNSNEPEEASELELAQIKIQQLQETVKQQQTFPKASELSNKAEAFTKQDIDLDTVIFRMSVKDYKFAADNIAEEMTEFIKKDLPAMKNRGWSVVEVTIKVVG